MKEFNPVFSVIVPVYNAEKYLDQCIESLVKQNEEDIEIILVNDGSTDSSAEICDKWAKLDRRIIVIHKENGGVVSACKRGYEISNGRYFSKVDSDDWVSPDFFTTARECIFENNPEVIVTDYISEPTGRTVKTKFVKNKVTDGKSFIKSHNRVHSSNDICYSCRMFFEKAFMQKYNLFFGEGMKIGEDTVLNLLAIKNAEKVIALDYAGYHYRTDNENSAMIKKYKESLERDLQQQYKIRKSCFNDIDSYIQDMAVYYVRFVFFSVINNCANSPEGLTYRDVKRILNTDWVIDSYKTLGFKLPFDSLKEKLLALVVKFRLALLLFLYLKK